MSTTMTLAQLETAVLQRADMVNSQFIAPAELDSYINQSAFELYDLLVMSYGENYFVQNPYQIITDGISSQFALPADFYKELGVDLLISAPNSWISLKQFPYSERNKYSIPGATGIWGPYTMRYRIQGNNLWLLPLPAGSQTIQLTYIPRFIPLASPTDTLEGVSGWTEYVIVDAAIKCLQKEESDTSVLMGQKSALIKRIELASASRATDGSQTVADVRGANGMPWGTGWEY